MAFSDDDAMESRLGEFLNSRIGRHVARREQKESFALYAHGILSDGERKSEPRPALMADVTELTAGVTSVAGRARSAASDFGVKGHG